MFKSVKISDNNKFYIAVFIFIAYNILIFVNTLNIIDLYKYVYRTISPNGGVQLIIMACIATFYALAWLPTEFDYKELKGNALKLKANLCHIHLIAWLILFSVTFGMPFTDGIVSFIEVLLR